MINQSGQYLIKSLVIFSGGATPGEYVDQTGSNKEFGVDVRGLFQEISIHENIFSPCVTGSILIHDGLGLQRKIRFDGNEYIYIHAAKYLKDGGPAELELKGTFLIYKVSERTNIGFNSEAYTLHFISPEFLLSEQQKVRKAYRGTYSNIIQNILTEYLDVQPNKTVSSGGTPYTINIIQPSPGDGVNYVIIPNLTPFKAINFLTGRALNSVNVPDFLFWQNHLFSYNFDSLSNIFGRDPDFEINFGAKNLTIAENINDELYYKSVMLGANDFRIISNFDLINNVKKGYYAGKFFAFDPLTRKYQIIEVKHDNVYGRVPAGQISSTALGDRGPSHANKYNYNTKVFNIKKRLADEEYESKITVYPFELDRTSSTLIQGSDPRTFSDIDKTHEYILQRKSIFNNLMQRVIRINMPGNFRFLAGKTVFLNFPHFYNERNKDEAQEVGDQSLAGKYIITAVRHIIRQDKHDTIIDVATDSSMINPITGRGE